MMIQNKRKFLIRTVAALFPLLIINFALSGCKQPASQVDTQKSSLPIPQKVAKEKQYPQNPEQLTNEDWKQRLSDMEYYVARQAGTEIKKSGKYWDNKQAGVYRCVCCGEELFSSTTKFESGTGWPSFWQPIADERILEEKDYRLLMPTRIEVKCKKCDGHLGHVFPDGPEPTGLRYCLNSAALDFEAGDPAAKVTSEKENTNPDEPSGE